MPVEGTDEITQHPVGVLGKTMTPELLKKKKPQKPSPIPESPLAAKAREIGSLGMPEARFANIADPGTAPGTLPTALGQAAQVGKKMSRKGNSNA